MNLKFTPSGWDDYVWFQKNERRLLQRINRLLAEVRRTPFEGIGKPEPLKGTWLVTGPAESTPSTGWSTPLRRAADENLPPGAGSWIRKNSVFCSV